VNNLNDGMSWGIYPLFFSSYGLGVTAIGALLSSVVADLLGMRAAILWWPR